MKNFKMSFIAIFAIFIGIAGSSFTIQKKTLTDVQWYKLDANGDASDASNYTFDDQDPDPSCASEPNIVCAVQLSVTNDNHPDAMEFATLKSSTSQFTIPDDNVRYKDSE